MPVSASPVPATGLTEATKITSSTTEVGPHRLHQNTVVALPRYSSSLIKEKSHDGDGANGVTATTTNDHVESVGGGNYFPARAVAPSETAPSRVSLFLRRHRWLAHLAVFALFTG